MTILARSSGPSRSLLPTIAACLLCSGAAACSSEVEVGRAKESPTAGSSNNASNSDSGGVQTPTGAAQATPLDCSPKLATWRQSYTHWTALPNNLAALASGTFVGDLPGGDALTLTIASDSSASFVVGEAAPAPLMDEGYLCGGPHATSNASPNFCPSPFRELAPGGTYAIHGASLDGDRLRVPLQPLSPYDAWCAQQQPHRVTDDDCFFDIAQNDSIKWGETGCFVGSRQVDCGWFQLAEEVHPCACSDSSCTAAIAETTSTSLDLRYLAAEGTLEGSVLFENGDSSSIQLVRIDK